MTLIWRAQFLICRKDDPKCLTHALLGMGGNRCDATLAFIEGAKPRDEIECALVIQMACTHSAAMAVLSRLGGAHGGDRSVAAMVSAAARLLRAYALDALASSSRPAGLGEVMISRGVAENTRSKVVRCPSARQAYECGTS
jgi:hypothetical protein